ncbi:MAG: tetratricopeptide repeat protein, partial [Mucilaginibacter sp.]
MIYRLSFILLILFSFKISCAQESISSDELFKKARDAAFEQKNYPLAISLSTQALQKSPDYIDIRVFLGRLYTWSKKPDSARIQFAQALQQKPADEDAAVAYASLEYWNDRPENALQLVEQGLNYHPASKDLLLLKAKVLMDLKKYKDASLTLDTLLTRDRTNTNARALASQIRDFTSKNKVGVSYDFVYFDKQFNDPWHL